VTFKLPKALIVLIICFTFVGQAMASTIMSYNVTNMISMRGVNEQSQSAIIMAHKGRKMVSDFSEHLEALMEDCCVKTSNDCFTGSCLSIAAFMDDTTGNDLIVDSSSKILFYPSLTPSQQPTPLYRPPILV